MKNNNKIHENLIKKLKDPIEADLYFEAVLKKAKCSDREEADRLFGEALNNLGQARPEDVNINVNENSLKLSALVRFLHFISKRFM